MNVNSDFVKQNLSAINTYHPSICIELLHCILLTSSFKKHIKGKYFHAHTHAIKWSTSWKIFVDLDTLNKPNIEIDSQMHRI